MKRLLDWLDDRTGYRQVAREALYEHIPGGSRWRYVFGSTLVFTFTVQVITGLFLWMSYSPSSQTAWESVYYIQHQMSGGWMLRGIHHYAATLMVVLLGLHLFQVVWDGAYKAPREINFWLGLILMVIVLGLALTGYLLPWDQKGYWATKVATNIVGLTPAIGPQMQQVVVGGSEYGHHTLTRFFALHAGVLPALLVFFVVLHIATFRRHGITTKPSSTRPDQYFWPDQILKDAVACLAVLLAVCGLAWTYAPELTAPADPAEAYNAARPEWYFLFLFQFLKLFHGEWGEIFGAIIVPGLVMGYLFIMPFMVQWFGRAGHVVNVAVLFVLMGGAVLLTGLAIREDANNDNYQRAAAEAELDGERAVELARQGIPPQGALLLMRTDPKTQGRKLFARHCAACHAHEHPQADPARLVVNNEPTAPNLYGFGGRDWVAGLLDPQQIKSKHYFGYEGSPFLEGDMVGWVTETHSDAQDAGDDQLETLNAEIDKVVKALSAEANLPGQAAADQADAADIEAGQTMIVEQTEFITCTDCHKFHDEGYLGVAPDLTDYASRQWLIDFVSNPAHERFYEGEKNDRMPAFHADPNDPQANRLDKKSLELIIDWLRGDWYEPEES